MSTFYYVLIHTLMHDIYLYIQIRSNTYVLILVDVVYYPYHPNMFSESCPPLAWDKENAYTREAVELYYEVCTCRP